MQIMQKKIDLVNGPVLSSLTRLAIPIMATSLIQMAYNMTDMIWIGRIGSSAVASVGAAGMYMWLSNGLAVLAKMGGQVNVGHALGAADKEKAAEYVSNALQLTLVLGIIYGIICILGARPLIHFFHLNQAQVIRDAVSYLKITCGLVLFSFLNQTFTGLFTAIGNSRPVFLATTTGLVVNIILDPLLIFAAKDTVLFRYVSYRKKPDMKSMKAIVRIGFPTSVQSMLFTGISMVIARLVAGYGDAAVAVQKVGSQIESISWMTADGFAAAVNSFTSQNHGAGKKRRIYQGYVSALKVVFVWGIFCTCLLIVCPAPVFKIFITEKEVIPLGVDYLRILGVSQLFMSLEITTAGAFAGYGKTVPPSVISIVFTTLRIPLALILVHTTLGLNGIWWSITISSIVKGVLLFIWVCVFMRRENILHNHIGRKDE